MKIKYRIFRSIIKSWETLFNEAIIFANTINQNHLITITVTSSGDAGTIGIVTVWYYEG